MRKKILWVLVSCLMALSLVLASCGPAAVEEKEEVAPPTKPEPEEAGPQRGGTLSAAMVADISSFDSAYGTSGSDLRYWTLLYDPIVYPTIEFKPVLEMSPIESWEFPDSTTVIFHVRKGVKFHDGTDYDAAAIKFNIDRMMEEGCPRKGYYAQVESVEVTADYTVVINLKAPDAVLMANLGHMPGLFSSPAMVKKWGDEYALHPTGSGPFRVTDMQRGVKYTFERFNDYWNKPYPYVDKVVIKVIPDETVRFAALKAGELDALFYARAKDQVEAKKTKGFQIARGGGTPCYLVPHNFKEPFTDKRARMAMAFAIDRDTINETLYYGLGFAHTQPLPSTIWGYNEDLVDFAKDYGFAYDPERSRELLVEAGYPDGFKFTAIVYSSETMVAQAQAVQGYLADIGIDMELEILDIGALAVRQTKGEYQALISTWTPPRDPATQLFLMDHSSGPWQGGKWKDERFEKLLEEAGEIYDIAERKKLYTEAQKILIENCYQIYLVGSRSNDLVAHNIHDYALWATGVWYPQKTWIEQ